MSNSSKADKFFRMATSLPFEEVKDDRNETSVPELAQVAELRDSGGVQDAVDYATALMKMYPDNDLVPFMISYMYYQKEFPKKAMQVAVDAIPRCPRKYRLYSVAGLAEFDLEHLPEAFVWWSRSIVAQCHISDFQEYDPFLHFAHSSLVIGNTKSSELFFSMTDAIEPSKPRLDPDFVDKLLPLRTHWVKEPLNKVMEHIEDTYFSG